MSKFWKIWTVATWFILTAHLAVNYWYWPSKIDQAYEQGKIDGQREIYHVWLEKGYVPVDSNDTGDIWYLDTSWVSVDSTDTMPAVDYTYPNDSTSGIDTLPEMDSLIICTVSVEVLKSFYRSTGIGLPIILPDTGGER